MSHPIEIKARQYFLEKIPNAKKSGNKTFDFVIDGRYAELKGKGASFVKIDFISFTNKQYAAIGKINFDIYLICGLNTSNPKMYKIDSKKLIKTRARKVVSYEYDKVEIKKII